MYGEGGVWPTEGPTGPSGRPIPSLTCLGTIWKRFKSVRGITAGPKWPIRRKVFFHVQVPDPHGIKLAPYGFQ